MATGRSNKLVGRTGEYLVAAELSRRGLVATTVTGNADATRPAPYCVPPVPHFDLCHPTQQFTVRATDHRLARRSLMFVATASVLNGAPHRQCVQSHLARHGRSRDRSEPSLDGPGHFVLKAVDVGHGEIRVAGYLDRSADVGEVL
jgi:hypothetical protein